MSSMQEKKPTPIGEVTLTSLPADGGRRGGPSLPCWSAEAASLSPLSKVKRHEKTGRQPHPFFTTMLS